jgi:hypothetical protein
MLHEGNMCHDFLVKIGARTINELIVMTDPPNEFRLLLNLMRDAARVSPRSYCFEIFKVSGNVKYEKKY